MKLENQVVSLELSKKLKELKVKQESLWWWILRRVDEPFELWREDDAMEYFKQPMPEMYPAYTVAELGEMLPVWVKERYYQLEIAKNDKNEWAITYGDHYYNKTGIRLCDYISDKSLANAMAKMLIYLIEKELVKI